MKSKRLIVLAVVAATVLQFSQIAEAGPIRRLIRNRQNRIAAGAAAMPSPTIVGSGMVNPSGPTPFVQGGMGMAPVPFAPAGSFNAPPSTTANYPPAMTPPTSMTPNTAPIGAMPPMSLPTGTPASVPVGPAMTTPLNPSVPGPVSPGLGSPSNLTVSSPTMPTAIPGASASLLPPMVGGGSMLTPNTTGGLVDSTITPVNYPSLSTSPSVGTTLGGSSSLLGKSAIRANSGVVAFSNDRKSEVSVVVEPNGLVRIANALWAARSADYSAATVIAFANQQGHLIWLKSGPLVPVRTSLATPVDGMLERDQWNAQAPAELQPQIAFVVMIVTDQPEETTNALYDSANNPAMLEQIIKQRLGVVRQR